MKKPTRKQRDPWEYALTCPLPPKSSYEFLDTLRLKVLKYLDWVTHDMVMEDEPKALREIQRVADRLTRITSMTPDASARRMADYEKQIEIQRLSRGEVDLSFDARVEAARLDDEELSPDDLNVPPEDIPF